MKAWQWLILHESEAGTSTISSPLFAIKQTSLWINQNLANSFSFEMLKSYSVDNRTGSLEHHNPKNKHVITNTHNRRINFEQPKYSILPVGFELRNRTPRPSLIPPVKAILKSPSDKLRRGCPLNSSIRNQTITIKNPLITPSLPISNADQIDPPILPNTNTLMSIFTQINPRNRSRMQPFFSN